MPTIKRLSAAAAILLAAGCSGGGGSNAVPKSPVLSNPSNPSNPSQPQSTQKTTVRIHIPAPTAKSSSSRHRAFVSASTSYVLVTETDSTFTNELTQVETDVTPTSPACTSDNNGIAGSTASPIVGSRTCTVQIDATPTTGSNLDSFEFDTYSSSQTVAMPNTPLVDSDGNPDAIPASALDSARLQQAITLDTANTISVTLDGEVASYMVVPGLVSGDGSQVINAQYAITAFDSSGEAIIAGANDPYTDGTNYPLTFSLSDDPEANEGPNSGYPAYSSFLTLTPGGPDFTGPNAGTTPFAQSADYLTASYDPHSDVTSYEDLISFAPPADSPILQNYSKKSGRELSPSLQRLCDAECKPIMPRFEVGFFEPIFIDPGIQGPLYCLGPCPTSSPTSNPSQPGSSTGTGSTNGSGPVFLQNDTSAPPVTAPINKLQHRAVAQRSFAGSRRRETGSVNTTGNNYPIVSFTAVGQTQTVTPVGGDGGFTATLSPGCTVTNGATVTVTQPSDNNTYDPSFTITATSNTQSSGSAGYTATDAFGQAITACTISFTDDLGNSALLEVTNTKTTSTPIDIDPGTLVTSSSTGDSITLFDTSSAFQQITQLTPSGAPSGVAIDPAHDLFVGDGQNVDEYPFTSTAGYVTPSTQVADSDGDVVVSAIAFSTNTNTIPSSALYPKTTASPMGEIALADTTYGRVYVEPVYSTPIAPFHNPWIGPLGTAYVPSITGVALDARGNIFAADNANGTVDEFYSTTFVQQYTNNGSAYAKPDRKIVLASGHVSGVAVDGSDNVFIADPYNGDIYEFTPTNQTGTPDLTITPDSMNQPACTGLISIAVTTTGGGETVYASCGVGNPGAVYSYSLSSGTGVYEPVTGVTGTYVSF